MKSTDEISFPFFFSFSLFYLSFFLFRIYVGTEERFGKIALSVFFKVPTSKASPRFQRFISFSRWNNSSQYFYDIVLETYHPLPFLKLNGYLEDIKSRGLHWPRRFQLPFGFTHGTTSPEAYRRYISCFHGTRSRDTFLIPWDESIRMTHQNQKETISKLNILWWFCSCHER